jgi:nitrite reductase/ring-hydroxylating ferredoxin subunit
MPTYIKVAAAADVTPGAGIVATVNEKEYAVYNLGGAYCVMDNTCLHRGGPLGEGELDGETVTCPWHGWQYNVKTGACLTKDGLKVNTYEVKVEGGDITIALP